jgi:hypothetical protein
MFIRSTGLGRTLLTARVANIETTELVPSTLEAAKPGAREPMRMLMVMQVVHPVNWTVRAFVDPSDLRHMIKVVLTNPSLILKGIRFLFSKDPVYPSAEEGEQAGAPEAGRPVVAPPVAAAAGPRRGPGPIPPR